MKKLLNALGILVSVFLTVVLAGLIFALCLLINIGSIIGKDGITDVLKKVDFVELFKQSNDKEGWNELVSVGEEVNLNEKQLEELLSSQKLKDEISPIFGDMVETILKGKTYQIDSETTKKLITVVIEEYNKVSDEKITDEFKERLTEYINDELVQELNDGFKEMNVEEEFDEETLQYVNAAFKVAFGSAKYAILVAILVVVGLIALARFSYYKWMPYLGVGSILSALLMMATSSVIGIINETELKSFIEPFTANASSKMNTTIVLLFVLAIASFVGHHFAKKKFQQEQPQIVEQTM